MSLNNNTLYNDNPNQRLSFEPSNTNFMQDATDINSALLALDQAITDFDQGTEIAFDPTGTDLVSTNVESAIKEHNPRIQSLEAEYSNVNLNSASDIKSELFSLTDTNNLTDALQAQIGTNTTNISNNTGNISTNANNITNLDNRVTTAETDINNLELSFPQQSLTSNADVKTAYEANSDTNAFSDALLSKLNGIEPLAKDDQDATEVPFTTTTTIPSTNARDAIEYVFANSVSAAIDTTYDDTVSGLGGNVQVALDTLAAQTGAAPMETQIKTFSESIGLYYGSDLLSSATANRNPKSIYLRDSNFKVDLTEGKWLITYQLATGPFESLYYLSGTLTADEATIEANSITQTFHQGRDPFGGAIIVDVSTPTSYTIWTIPPANQNGRFFEGTNIGPTNPDQVATISAVRLSAPSVGDASAVSYSGGTTVQAELDDHETRLTTAETDIDNLEAIVGQESAVVNNTFLGRASAPPVPNALYLPSAGVGGALADSTSLGATSRPMLYDTSNGRLFPIQLGDLGACLQNQGGFVSMQKPLSQFVDFNTSISSLSSTNARDAIEEVDARVVILEGAHPSLDNFYIEDLTTSQTTANSYSTKLTLNINPAVSSNYLVSFVCEIRDDVGTGLDMNFRLDTNNEIKARAYVPSTIGNWGVWSGSTRFTLAAGSHDFDIRYRSAVGGNNMRIRDAKITAIKLD